MGWGWLLLAIGLSALAIAVVLGGREERIFVAVQAVSGAAEHTVLRFGHDIVGAILIDLGVLAVVLPLALLSSKTWPLLAASLCVATLMTECAQVFVHAETTAYGIIQGGWDLLADGIVAVGAWNVWRSRRWQAQFAAAQTKTPDPG